ncbi:MAG: ABC transporter substrate-binding protein [Elusimicrobia bacterium]|nr:ABC transporter substrate-binding protein [Elusimicrobiota bacterium]
MTRRLRAAAAILAAIAATRPAAFAQVKNPDTFIYATIGEVDSLDPAWSYDSRSHHILRNVYELLVQFKGTSLIEFEPLLAAQIPSTSNGLISKDGLTYTFPIRKGVVFHDGTPLVPEDVKYSFIRYMLQDRAGGPSSLLLDPILGINATRDKDGKPIPDLFQRADKAITVAGDKVSIKLARPYSPFLGILASHGEIISKSWCVKNGCWDGTEATWMQHNNPQKQSSYLLEHVNGTGPYALDRWDRKNKEVVLRRNDKYWRKPPALKTIVIRSVEEFATRKLMLQAGDADTTYVPIGNFPQVQDMKDVKIYDRLSKLETPIGIAFTFKLNTIANPYLGSGKLDGDGIPPEFFSDKDIRLGFARSMDHETYVKDILRGKGSPTRGLIQKGMLGYNADGANVTFSPEKATEHFKKAWGGKVWEKGFQFTMVYNDTQPNVQAMFQMIKKNVEALNPKFKIDIRTVQWPTYLDQGHSHKLPMFLAMWSADFPDPHNMVFPYYHTHGDWAFRQNYSNPKLDKMIEDAIVILDPEKRDKAYREIQRVGFEEMPQMLIADRFRFRIERDWVKGWIFRKVEPDAPYGDYYYDLSKEAK